MNGCGAICYLSRHIGMATKLGSIGGCELVIRIAAMQNYPTNPGVAI